MFSKTSKNLSKTTIAWEFFVSIFGISFLCRAINPFTFELSQLPILPFSCSLVIFHIVNTKNHDVLIAAVFKYFFEYLHQIHRKKTLAPFHKSKLILT